MVVMWYIIISVKDKPGMPLTFCLYCLYVKCTFLLRVSFPSEFTVLFDEVAAVATQRQQRQ